MKNILNFKKCRKNDMKYQSGYLNLIRFFSVMMIVFCFWIMLTSQTFAATRAWGGTLVRWANPDDTCPLDTNYDIWYNNGAGGGDQQTSYQDDEQWIGGYATVMRVNGSETDENDFRYGEGSKNNVNCTTTFETFTEPDGNVSVLVKFNLKNNNSSTATVGLSTMADIQLADDDNAPMNVLYIGNTAVGFSTTNLKCNDTADSDKVSLNYFFKEHPYIVNAMKGTTVTNQTIWTGHWRSRYANRWNHSLTDINYDEWHDGDTTMNDSNWLDTAFAASWTVNIPANGTAVVAYVLSAAYPTLENTVTYNANGGSGSMAVSRVTAWTDLTLRANTFTKSGYKFIGWSTNSSATTPEYTNQQKVTIYKDITLYAIWEKSYTLIPKPTISGSFTYDGTQKDATSLLTNYDSSKMSISGHTQTNVGTYTLTISLLDTNNYHWNGDTTSNVSLEWKINSRSITITAKNQTIVYGSSIATGATQVTANNLASGHSISAVTLTTNRDTAGTGTITPSVATIVSGSTNVTANYTITYATGTLIINPRTITDGTLSFGNMQYTGTARESTPVLLVAGKTLVNGIDYTVSYSNNVESGMAYGTVTGTGNYKDSLTSRFLIYVTKTVLDVTGLEFVNAENSLASSGTDYDAPTIVVGTQKDSAGNWATETAWSKTKDLIITATDAGTQIARIRFQKANDTVDIYGIGSRDTSVNPVTNNREYQFTGDVTGYVTAKVFLRDDVSNITTENLRVYNLDNTVPTISMESKVIGNIAEINLKDTASGLKYFAVTSASQTTAPTTYGTTDVVVGKNLDYWYSIANPAAVDPTDTTARDVNVLFKTLQTGNYKIWAQDLVGNITSQEFEVDNNPLVTEWTVPAGATIKLPIPSNASNNYIVDWGDDTYDKYTIESFPTHTYSNTSETTYTIQINGVLDSFGYNSDEDVTSENTDYYTFTEYVTSLKNWGDVGVKQIGFAYCENLGGTIPEPLENSFKNIQNIDCLFAKCRNLTGSIPTNLFAGLSNVLRFDWCFIDCEKLTGSIPESLFADAISAVSFDSTFAGCINLEGSIPSKLFENNKEVYTFFCTFNNCSKLTGSIPEILFTNTTKVQTFESIFNGCEGLTGNIPSNLFEKTNIVTNFSFAFSKCKNLEGTIPKNLFATNPDVTTFSDVFAACSKLSGTIPEDLFAANIKAEDFDSAFADCSSLTGMIPAKLFENNVNAKTFMNTFINCTGLTAGEIIINTANVNNVNGMFNGCKNLESLVFSKDFNLFNGVDMFKDCTSLRAIVTMNSATTVAELPVLGELATIGLPEQTVFYVPNEDSEIIYELDWQEKFGTEIVLDEFNGKMVTKDIVDRRVEPILSLAGNNPLYIGRGKTYVDPGYTVAGFTIDEESKYSIYDLNVNIGNLPVDTSTTGTKLVSYEIFKESSRLMGLVRQIIVREIDLSLAEVTMEPTTFEYDGTEHKPDNITVTLGRMLLMENTDYSIEYVDNKNVGTGKVIINSKGIYEGSWSGDLIITPRKLEIEPTSGIFKFSGQEDPVINYKINNLVTGEEPITSGSLSRVGAGTQEGEATGEYAVTMGTLTLNDNGNFLVNNYEVELLPEIIRVIDGGNELFITRWKVTDGETIQLPIPSNELNDFMITWGDGKHDEYTTEAFPTHTYETAGVYEINLYGVCKHFGYVGEQNPEQNNVYKDYYSFVQDLIGIKQWGDIEVERLGFSHCVNLIEALPNTTGFSKLKSFENMFYNCTSLPGTIPANFTEEAYDAVSAKNMFSNCLSLTGSIPEDLFANKYKIITFENTFNNCNKLEGDIPEKLFAAAKDVVSYQRTFKDCSKLTGVLPIELFAASPNVQTFSETFANCVSLVSDYNSKIDQTGELHLFLKEAIPNDFFKSNTKVRNYYRMFYNCTGLTGEVTKDLLSSNKVLRRISNESASYSDYRGMFEGCTGIEKVSLSILCYGKEMFKGCTSISEIDLRETYELGEEAFYGCNKLQNITIEETFFKLIGTDAFEYTDTEPALLLTRVNRSNEVLVGYDWLSDNRLVDVEAPKGTVEIETEKYPFTKSQDVTLKITVADNYSESENCQMAIVNEDQYEDGVTYEDLKWQPFEEQVTWELTAEDAAKIVYVYFKDEAGNVSEALDYLYGRIKIVPVTGTMMNKESVEVELVSAFAGNNRQKNYKFRKEICVCKVTDPIEYVEYTGPITISDEGNNIVAARLVELVTGTVVDETIQTISIDTKNPEVVEYEVLKATLNGTIYYGEYYDEGNSNNGIVIRVTEGIDYNANNEENAISEIVYSVVKDGETIIENKVLENNTIYLEEIGDYVVLIHEVDMHGNRSEHVTIQAKITERK